MALLRKWRGVVDSNEYKITDEMLHAGKVALYERKMLSTPPKPHDGMKKGAAPKRDPHFSGKGSKS
jgi:hypothetical protein